MTINIVKCSAGMLIAAALIMSCSPVKSPTEINDFEDSLLRIPVGTNFEEWKYASPPVHTPELGQLPPEHMVEYKAKAFWYSALPVHEITLVNDIWPDRTVRRGHERVHILQIQFQPERRAEYNYTWNLQEKIYSEPHTSWGGMMRILDVPDAYSLNEDLVYIEFWARIEGDIHSGNMFLNLGEISERIIYEERLHANRINGIHQEDGSRGQPPTGVLNQGEDVGLDGLTTEEEREVFSDWLEHYRGTPFYDELYDDPSGDRAGLPAAGDYSRLNGVEGNAAIINSGIIPDTEDLNRNGLIDLTNNYYEYTVSLDTTDALQKNPHIVDGGHNNWYLFRIPIDSYDRTVGYPSFENAEFMRIWFTGFKESVHVRMAEFSFTEAP
jgi:cell surface protein SprA